jgi:cytochrome c peroxidase
MQGRGLLSGPLHAELAEPNHGRSPNLDALAAYSNSHEHPLSPYSKHGLSPAAQRGKELFFAKETRCSECHSGPHFTDSQPRPKLVKHNVGTGEDDPGEKMGPEYDTPTLLGVYRTAPYLHHGKAATLLDVLTTYNRQDQHGKTSHLNDQQLHDLVDYLRALPFEDVESASVKAKLIKVEK